MLLNKTEESNSDWPTRRIESTSSLPANYRKIIKTFSLFLPAVTWLEFTWIPGNRPDVRLQC